MKLLKWLKSLFVKKDFPQSWIPKLELDGLDDRDAYFDDIFGDAELFGKASKDWRQYLPQLEIQGFGDCVSFSRNNCAELIANIKGVVDENGNEFNLSDLDLAVGSGTTTTGNSLKKVAEYARKIGVSLEKDCPYTYRWSERQGRFNTAKNKQKFKLGNWSWVNCNANSIKSALEFSPVQIAIGVGYNYNNDGIIQDPKSYKAYHAITATYVDENDNIYIFDHYDKSEKILAKGYDIFYAMIFKELPENWRTLTDNDAIFYKRMIGKLIILPEKSGEVYRIEETCLRKVRFVVTDKKLWDILQIAMREKKVFLGVSNKDFDRLSKIAFESGNKGIVEADESIDVSKVLEK